MNGAGEPGGERERAELAQVLASPLFNRAPALSRILTFICEKRFRGEAESIKEYSIAIEALGRPQDFDSNSDTIVRVEASRLRRRLRQYYETEGAGHQIQISLPESGYVPQFVSRPEGIDVVPIAPVVLEPEPEVAPAPLNTAWWLPSRVRLGAGLLLAVAVALALLYFRGAFRPSPTSGPAKPAASQSALAEQATADSAIRIRAGFQGPKFIDSLGRTWLGDRFFSGGNATARSFRRIYRTRSQEFYRTARTGDFQYDIPLQPGVYELHLHFAEIVSEETDLESGGEQTSRFHIYINDKLMLRGFDVVADAFGPNVADERVWTDVTPAADGQLHLRFVSFMNRAHLSGIEILPGIRGKMHPVRIAASSESVFDSDGNLWGSDRYALGGKITHRGTVVENTSIPSLYGSERWGNFNYAIPAAPGRYRVTLRFAETYPAQFRVGERVFDVYCNGVALLKDFDVFAEAGRSNRAWDKVFRGLRPNSQGKLLLSFVPVQNYAIVNAIEVVAED